MKRTLILYVIVVFLIPGYCFGQHITGSSDLSFKVDTSRLKRFIDASRQLQEQGLYQQALKYADSAVFFAESWLAGQRNNPKNIIFKEEATMALINRGAVHNRLRNYPESMKNMFSALKIAEEINYTYGKASCNLNIGQVYFMQNNFREALNHYMLALKSFETTGDKKAIAKCYNNIAGVYFSEADYSRALKNSLVALKIREQIGDQSTIADSYNNIGEILSMQRNYSGSLQKHLQSLAIRERLNDKNGICMSENNIGIAYLNLGKYDLASNRLNKSLVLAKVLNDKERLKEIYQSLANVNYKLKNYHKAYEFHTRYAAMKDTLISEFNARQMAEMKARYESEKKEKEIAILNKNNQLLNLDKQIQADKIEKQKYTVRYLIAGIFLLLTFSVLAFLLYRQKRRTVFKHAVLKSRMQALRAQMNPHFTFNVLNSIQYYIRSNNIKSAEIYLNKFSKLIRMILEQSRNSHILLKKEIAMLELYLGLEQMLFENKFKYTIEVDKNLDVGTIFIPGMLIQPIVENSIKHGLEHKEGEAVINISFLAQKNTVSCTVSDNGIGREAAEKIKASVRNVDSEDAHISAATKILNERMETLSQLYSIELRCITEDILNQQGLVAGTRVQLIMPVNHAPE